MIFTETKLKGAFIVEPEKRSDKRGFFARTFCIKEFEEHGMHFDVAQCNISFNKKKGTLRGMHYQRSPYEEAKLVRCTMGKIYDVIVDIRPDSITFKKWISVELSDDNYKMIYIPKGFAHGFQALTENTEVFYQMDEFYYPEFACGFRWNDPLFNIKWPYEDITISAKDKNCEDFKL